jgi:hypothetical protein
MPSPAGCHRPASTPNGYEESNGGNRQSANNAIEADTTSNRKPVVITLDGLVAGTIRVTHSEAGRTYAIGVADALSPGSSRR